MDLEKLKALAEAATGGDWVVDGEFVNEHGNLLEIYVGKAGDGRVGSMFANCMVSDDQARANAEFVAAARPVTVLELIAKIEALEGDLQRRREAHRKTWTQLEQLELEKLQVQAAGS